MQARSREDVVERRQEPGNLFDSSLSKSRRRSSSVLPALRDCYLDDDDLSYHCRPRPSEHQQDQHGYVEALPSSQVLWD
jgi:hypothetical protein